jgi:hypothetical protein
MMYLCASAGSARWLTYGLPAPYSCPLELRELKLIHSANGSSNLWLELHAEVTASKRSLCNAIDPPDNVGMKEVNMSEPGHLVDDGATSYATATDFVDTFTEQLDSLYLLSLLLTADNGKAEQCLVCAMGDCVDGSGVFKGFMDSASCSQVCNPNDHAYAGACGEFVVSEF